MLKGLLTYYGGKQRLAPVIVPLIPVHKLYCEPFAGGAAVLFHKEPSACEVLNDTNLLLINFYQVVKENFSALQDKIQSTLYHRRCHEQAVVIYNYPELFSALDRAWAIWVLSKQGFAGKIGECWGYDIDNSKTAIRNYFAIEHFSQRYADRLSRVEFETMDARYIIQTRDAEESFFYCDPPYFNSTMGHYKGYTKQDFQELLNLLAVIKGKFLLSSYPSKLLEHYQRTHGWPTLQLTRQVCVDRNKHRSKTKTEVLTANYPIEEAPGQLRLFRSGEL